MLTNQNKIIKVAIYCRVSTDSTDQANSLQSQQSYFKEYIQKNPMWELSEIYVDEGLSGTSTKKRKAFNKMIADARNKKFDCLITKEISRFARNTLDSVYYTRKLKEYGVGVIFANDNLFTLDPDAELRLTIMSSIAQEESRKTSDRVKWGQKRRMEQGVVFGRDLIGYKVKDGKLYVDPEGAKTVQLIFHKYTIEHKGTTTIARELKEAGIPTLNNKNWTNTVILRLLRNEKYCGDLIQKKTYTPNFLTHKKEYNNGEEEKVVIRDHHSPIISRELFDLTQIEIERRSPTDEQKKKSSNRYCFSGKIICAECGSSYVCHNKKLKNGSHYKYWQCYQKRRYGKQKHIDNVTGQYVGCDSMQVSHDDLIHMITQVVATLGLNADKYITILRSQLEKSLAATNHNSNQELIAEHEKANERKNRLVDLYLDGCITKDEFKHRSDTTDSDIERLKIQIEKTGSNHSDSSVQTKIEDCLQYATVILQSNGNNQEFIKNILENMTIDKQKNVTVKLKSVEYKWNFAPLYDTV